jgi:hypothetical protein
MTTLALLSISLGVLCAEILYARFDQIEKKNPTDNNDHHELRITFNGTSVTFKFKNEDDGEMYLRQMQEQYHVMFGEIK